MLGIIVCLWGAGGCTSSESTTLAEISGTAQVAYDDVAGGGNIKLQALSGEHCWELPAETKASLGGVPASSGFRGGSAMNDKFVSQCTMPWFRWTPDQLNRLDPTVLAEGAIQITDGTTTWSISIPNFGTKYAVRHVGAPDATVHAGENVSLELVPNTGALRDGGISLWPEKPAANVTPSFRQADGTLTADGPEIRFRFPTGEPGVWRASVFGAVSGRVDRCEGPARCAATSLLSFQGDNGKVRLTSER